MSTQIVINNYVLGLVRNGSSSIVGIPGEESVINIYDNPDFTRSLEGLLMEQRPVFVSDSSGVSFVGVLIYYEQGVIGQSDVFQLRIIAVPATAPGIVECEEDDDDDDDGYSEYDLEEEINKELKEALGDEDKLSANAVKVILKNVIEKYTTVPPLNIDTYLDKETGVLTIKVKSRVDPEKQEKVEINGTLL